MSTATERRFVSQLGHNEQVQQVFLASDKQLRPNRNGNLYLQVELSDRSGAISTRLWNASEQDYRSFENGDYVVVDGATQLFQGNMQLIATAIRKARHDEVEEADFITLQSADIDRMAARLAEILRSIRAGTPQPGRVLPDGPDVYGQVHRGPRRHEEPSCVQGWPAGTRARPDGVDPRRGSALSNSSIATSC